MLHVPVLEMVQNKKQDEIDESDLVQTRGVQYDTKYEYEYDTIRYDRISYRIRIDIS